LAFVGRAALWLTPTRTSFTLFLRGILYITQLVFLSVLKHHYGLLLLESTTDCNYSSASRVPLILLILIESTSASTTTRQCLLVPTHPHTRLTRPVANMTCLERLLATPCLCDQGGMLCPGIQGRMQIPTDKEGAVLGIGKASRLGIQGRHSQTGEGTALANRGVNIRKRGKK
jgi:hypothetical protein